MLEPESFSTILIKCGRTDLRSFVDNLKRLSYNLEIKSVADDYREINVFYLNQSSYDRQIQDLTDNGLYFQPLSRVKKFDGFSNKHEVVDKIGENTSVYGAISKDKNRLKEFKEYFNSGDDYKMGLLLGYPECCCRGYLDYKKKFVDPVYEIAQQSKNYGSPIQLENIPWSVQVHMRYFGFKVIPFFPCDFTCDEAKSFADRWYNLMSSIDSKTTNDLKTLMLKPSTWSLYNCQVLVNRPPSDADFMGYAVSSYFPQKREVDFYAV